MLKLRDDRPLLPGDKDRGIILNEDEINVLRCVLASEINRVREDDIREIVGNILVKLDKQTKVL